MIQIKRIISKSIDVKNSILNDDHLLRSIEKSSNRITQVLKQGGKILFCGNGGSASDAQHLAAELSGRFYLDRAPLFAEALHTNASFVTAVANDYGYQAIFSRAVEAKGRKGDILLALSTSGNSENIENALRTAKKLELTTIGMTGESGGRMNDLCDILMKIPSGNTPRIQEAHIMIGHIICELVEAAIFGENSK